ncbi:hypothetical protein [Acinetobacter baumannii]|uniref:hypothetical protein n=1 Tax=Acinetobacter baumannii TaxID=470 RepID=UPI000DCFA5DF|nr:hypothetical protein [Acinetobacter baumannii]QUV69064.1 hypothetical protein KPZ59_01308 [Acinetobacter baumannii]
MKKILIVGLLGFGFTASAYANTCNYEQIKSSEYQLTDLSKKYVTNSFFIDPDKDMLASVHRNEKGYKALKENKFKVFETGVVTKYHDRFIKTGVKNFTEDLVVNGKAYTLNKSLSTKLITSNCEIYYLNLDRPIDEKFIGFTFLKVDNSPADSASLQEIVGKALQVKDTSATVAFDRFEKIVNIKTKDFDNMLLRGTYSPTTKKLLTAQLYLNTSFIGKWGNIQIAYDADGNTHEVVKNDRDADCSNRYMDCKLSEVVGVSLSEPFLRKNKNGFELKLKGQQDRIIKVPSDIVVSFLDGLDAAKKQY